MFFHPICSKLYFYIEDSLFIAHSMMQHLAAIYKRFLLSLREFLLSQHALLDPPLVWVNLRPLPKPRDDLPAEVRPRSSRCFWVALHIQLILGSRVTALWWGSIMITSKYLWVESWPTQYEFSTRSPLRRRPTRSSAMDCKFLSGFCCLTAPEVLGLP